MPELLRRVHKPWQQLAFVLGDAGLALLVNGVLFILISRLLGPEALGIYALATAWLLLFQGVSTFGIPEFLVREVGAYGRGAGDHVFHATVLGLGSGVIALCAMLAGVRILGYPQHFIDVISVAGLALLPGFLNLVCRSVYLALRQMHLAFLAMLIEATIVTAASLYLLLSGFGVFALMVALVASKIVSASVSLSLLYGGVLHTRPSFDAAFMMRMARTIFTFGIGSMLAMIAMRINTVMASFWVGIATLGHFAAATKILEIGLMAPALFVQLLMSRMAHSFATDNKLDPNSFGPWYEALFAFVVPVCVGVWVFAEPLLETLFGAGFGGAVWVLRVLMIYLVIESADAVMSVTLKAVRKQREDVTCLAFNPLTNVALNLALLPSLGTLGAAIARVGGGGASTMLRQILVARQLDAIHWLRFARKPLLVSIGVGTICFLLRDLGKPVWLLLLYVTATAGLLRLWSGISIAAIKDMMSPSGPT